MVHVVMTETHKFSHGQKTAVYDAGVVELVTNYCITLAQQTGDSGQIGGIATGHGYGRIGLFKFSNSRL